MLLSGFKSDIFLLCLPYLCLIFPRLSEHKNTKDLHTAVILNYIETESLVAIVHNKHTTGL